MLNAIRGAQAPEKFTYAFLESLEFKSSSDRLFIGVLKFLGFLDSEGRPQDRYFRYLDQSQSELVMAEALRDAYEDLFRVKVDAYKMTRPDLKNKLKTLSQGSLKESVLDKMAMTFSALVSHADFDTPSPEKEKEHETPPEKTRERDDHETRSKGRVFGGLHYNIQIILPATRDTQVYDAIFRSLKEHLGD